MAGAALILNVTLNFLLIPRYHEVAAAGVTSLTELVLLVIGLRIIPRELIPLGSAPTLVKSLVASAAMAGVVLALSHYSILAILPAAGLTYAAVGALVRLIPREDVRSLLGAVRRKASHEPSDASATPQAALDLAVNPYDKARLIRSGRTLTPERAAWLEWLQAPTNSSERARLVTRARSTSIPLTAAQVTAGRRSTPLPTPGGQRSAQRAVALAAPTRRSPRPAVSTVRARRQKAASAGRVAHRVAVAI
jgi:hypothetical protein